MTVSTEMKSSLLDEFEKMEELLQPSGNRQDAFKQMHKLMFKFFSYLELWEPREK